MEICTGFDKCIMGLYLGTGNPGWKGCRGCLHRDLSDLDERLAPYYMSGERVEVEWAAGMEDWTGYGARCNGKRGRFYIGRSTGWKPSYVRLARIDSISGGGIGGKEIQSVRGLGIFKRR